jgi:acyl dehydratase
VRYFEDFAAGQSYELGVHHLTRDEIVAFAEEFDPQPFHLDEDAARHSPFKGLVASGWHTTALFMRLYVNGLLGASAGMGSPGIEELRWLRPARPGDTLQGRFTVLETWPSQNHPGRGTVRARCELLNQAGEPVLEMTARGFFARRPGAREP